MPHYLRACAFVLDVNLNLVFGTCWTSFVIVSYLTSVTPSFLICKIGKRRSRFAG